MTNARPSPEGEINHGTPTVPRPAATVIVLRGGAQTLEVLLVRRTPRARFMGDVWVFPGGAVDPEDGTGDAGLRVAARRELAEEAGIALAPDQPLTAYTRWITPAAMRIRYDTWFFLTAIDGDQTPQVDGEEIVEYRWLTPAAALTANQHGELRLVFPTIRHLEQLSAFATADAAMAHAHERPVEPVQPQVVGEGQAARIVLPGEPGYEA